MKKFIIFEIVFVNALTIVCFYVFGLNSIFTFIIFLIGSIGAISAYFLIKNSFKNTPGMEDY